MRFSRRPSTTVALACAVALAAVAARPARGVIVGTSPDSPAAHVDPNVSSSPYAGVVGLDVAGLGPATGVLLRTSDPTHSYVLTAAHVVNNTSVPANTVVPSAITVSVNYTGARSTILGVSAVNVNPAYFVNYTSGHDDLAVLQLNGVVPAGVPTYQLLRTAFTPAAQAVTIVGYGQSGDGVSGTTIGADTSVKRFGQNRADAAEADDEGGGGNELYLFDFDRPDGSNGPLGGPSLGNASEVTFGIGDSGGPAFVAGTGGELFILGINTFGLDGGDFPGGGGSGTDLFPRFGSGAGGQVVASYQSFIDQYSVPEPGAAGAVVAAGLLGLVRRRRRRGR